MQNQTKIIGTDNQSDNKDTIFGESSPDTDIACQCDGEELMEYDSDVEDVNSLDQDSASK